MSNCIVCNEGFDHGWGYDDDHCDEWCARSTNPEIKSMHIALLDKPKKSMFNYYIEAFKSRGRSIDEEEAEERILKSGEYIRLKLKMQERDLTVTNLKKVKA